MEAKSGRYPNFVAVKVPTELLQAIRQAARDDDRTVSSWLRRVIAAAVRRPDERESATR